MGRPRLPVPVGERFGHLTVLGPAGHGSKSQSRWECRCDCGEEKVVQAWKLRSGKTTSCGCMVGSTVDHGHARTEERHPLYATWVSMRQRCRDPKATSYKNYGGRGIEVCARWDESFPAFLEDMGEKPTPSHTLDRIDNDGNYEPGNVRWATWNEQMANRQRKDSG